MNLNKSALGILLSHLDDFKNPKVQLEQYKTDSEIAAEVVWHAFVSGFVKDKTVADIGCGTGVLGIAALLLGAKKVYFLDIDRDALETAKQNLEKARQQQGIDGEAEFIHADASMFRKRVDMILQNPPFGTRNKHADLEFLRNAFRNSDVVYSFHKLETMEFIDKIIATLGFRTFAFFKFDFPLKNTMPQHTKHIERIRVGCWAVRK